MSTTSESFNAFSVRGGSSSVSRRRFLGLTGGAALGLGLSACSPGSAGVPGSSSAPSGAGGASGYEGPAVSLNFWNGFTGGDGPIMKKLVAQFMTEHSNIKVTMNTMQWADYYAKLPSAVTAGKGPEVAIMHVDSVATNAARRVIQPLDDVATALKLSESDFAPVPWKAGLYQDKRYAIPLDVHPLGFFYNKTVMEIGRAGSREAADQRRGVRHGAGYDEEQGRRGSLGHAVPLHRLDDRAVAALAVRRQLFSEDASTATWADEPGVKAMTWFVDLVRNGASPGKIAQDADIVALQNGKNAFNWNGIWTLNTLAGAEQTRVGCGRVAQHRWHPSRLGRIAPVRAAHAEEAG